MEQQLIDASIWGLAAGFSAGGMLWIWRFAFRWISGFFSERLILD